MSSRKHFGALMGASVLSAIAMTWAGVACAAPDLGALSVEQKAFIEDAATLHRFGMTKDKLFKILDGRSAEEVELTVVAMMQTIADAKFQPAPANVSARAIPEPLDPDGDMAEIPLNPAAGGFNGSTVLRPPVLDQYKYDPGLFSLKRYMYEEDGIPTFAGAPIALRKEDLVAGKVDVAFVGVPLALGSGWRDSQNASGVMRAMYGMGGYDIYAGIDPSLELTLADYGNLAVDNMAVEANNDHIRMMIGDMVDAGVVPFIIGGDHSVMFPTVSAMSDKFGAANVGVVHLDAHYNGERDLDHAYSDKQAVSALLRDGVVKGSNVIQVGIRGSELTEEGLKWMKQQGVRYHTMAEVEGQGWEKVVNTTLQQVRSGPKNIFVSFDMSVLDPAFGQGAGRPYPGGLTMREAVPMVRRLCAESHVVGFEILDVAPMLDLSYATALNANYIMHACLTGVAMRKKGLTQADYLSPLTSGIAK